MEKKEYTREKLIKNGWKHKLYFSSGKEVFIKDDEEIVWDPFWDRKTGIVILKYKSYTKKRGG